MPNRYKRDELISTALNMSQVVQLIKHDCPDGVVQTEAYSIQWLQDIIDFWYHMVPFSSGVTMVQLNIPAHTNAIPVPDDFILDVRNGYLIQTTEDSNSKRRMIRVPLQKWINRDLHAQGQSANHSVFYMVQGRTIKVTPAGNVDRNAWLWYYFLPPTLLSNDTPLFPNDYVMTEYLRIRALEWCGSFEPGTAQKFCDKVVGGMKAAGLMNESEDDEIPFDTLVHIPHGRYDAYAWLGPR